MRASSLYGNDELADVAVVTNLMHCEYGKEALKGRQGSVSSLQ
jgi:hypothetical protein